MPTRQSLAAEIMDEPCSSIWRVSTHTQPHKAGDKTWTTAKSPSTASPPSESNRSFQAKLLSGTGRRGSSQTLLSTSKSCLMTPICWPSTNLAGCPLSPAAALWKTPSCGWCKSKLRTQTLSTGWAELLPASSSSPKHDGWPLSCPQTGTHPEFKKSTERWLKALQSKTPTKFSHPLASYRTRSLVPCGPPTQVPNRQSHWRRCTQALQAQHHLR